MKKIICILLAVSMLIPLTSCGGKDSPSDDSSAPQPGDGVVVSLCGTRATAIFNAPHAAGTFIYNREFGEAYIIAASDCTAFTYNNGSARAEKLTSGGKAAVPTNGILILTDKSIDISGDISIEYPEKYLPTAVSTEGAYAADKDGVFVIRLRYYNPAEIPEDGAAVFEPLTTDKRTFGSGVTSIWLERSSGIFKAVSHGAGTTSSKYFTVAVTDTYEAVLLNDVFTDGAEMTLHGTSGITPYGDSPTVLTGGAAFVLDAVNPDAYGENGIYLCDNAAEPLPALPTGSFVQAAIVENRIVYVGSSGEAVTFPSVNGCLLTFTGNRTSAAADAVCGDEISTLLFEPEWSPAECVTIGGRKVSINYHDETRAEYTNAVLYTPDFRSLTTETNEWGLEIAVSGDTVTAVSPAAAETSGNTAIPADGYVLSVSMSHLYYMSLTRTKVGDKAEHTAAVTPYSVYEITVAGSDRPAENGECVIYTASYGDKTPSADSVAEVAADASGAVVGIYGSGGSVIPDGGFVLSAAGEKKNELLRFASEYTHIYASSASLRAVIAELPADKLARAKALRAEYADESESAGKALKNLDYDMIYSVFAKADTAISSGLSGAAEACSLLGTLKYAFTESQAVQNRGAWCVTRPTDDAGVRKNCEYAKSLNINVLYVDVFNGTYAMYDSHVAGVIRSKLGGAEYDALEAYCRIGHELGLEIVPMFCCFNAGNTLNVAADHYVNIFKKRGKLLLSKRGNIEVRYYDAVTYTLDPYDKDVRQFQLDIIREIISNYDVDGLMLDYIRFPLPSYYGNDPEDFGYNKNTVADFIAEYGKDPMPMLPTDALWDEWCSFRSDIVTSFVGEVYALKESVKSGLRLYATCFADKGDREKYVFQSPEKWVENGWADGVFSMIYADTFEDEKKYADELLTVMPEGKATLLSLGIGTYVGASDDDINKQCALSANPGFGGISFFALKYIGTGGYRKSLTEGALRNPSAETFEYAVTGSAGLKQLEEYVNNVYKRFAPDNDYGELLSAIAAIKAYSDSAKTDTAEEKTNYVNKMKGLLGGVVKYAVYPEGEINASITAQTEYLASVLGK